MVIDLVEEGDIDLHRENVGSSWQETEGGGLAFPIDSKRVI